MASSAAAVAGELKGTREQIEYWRRTRPCQSPMPEALWAEATSLAQRHGTFVVARGLRVDFGALKKRVERAGKRAGGAKGAAGGRFVELSGAQLFAPAAPMGAMVEVSTSDGAQLTVRLAVNDALDVAGLVDAFRRRRA